MRRPTFADPKTEFVFKRIFGVGERKHVLLAFLDGMLGLDERRRIIGVELLPPAQRPSVAELELSILGVRCVIGRSRALSRPEARRDSWRPGEEARTA